MGVTLSKNKKLEETKANKEKKSNKNKKLQKPKRSLLKAEPINEGLKKSYDKPNPRKLFGQLWWEKELVICFASTNVGKTLLAMQIAESLATGTQVFKDDDNPCKNETEAMKVLYVDAELTYKQIENRYKNYVTKENYELSSNIIRAEINRDFLWQKGDNMEELIKEDIKNLIEEHKPEALIVDNLKMLRKGTEKSHEALPMMFELNNLKGKYNISILVLGHTPKIDVLSPILINHLSGSSDIANASDGIFAIAKTKEDNATRYIKELKQRNVQFKFGSGNVLLCTIDQPESFTGFFWNSLCKESQLLSEWTEEAKKQLKKEIIQYSELGLSSRDIEKKIPWGKSKIIEVIQENKELSTKGNKDKVDKVDKKDKPVQTVLNVQSDLTVLDGQNIKAS